MLHLPAKGQPRPHVAVQVLGAILWISMGWLEISGPDEHPIVGLKLVYWLGISVVGVLVMRRITLRAPNSGPIRMLQIASARTWIAGSVAWLAILVFPLIWSPPHGSVRDVLPLLVFLSIFPIATLLHVAWELSHPVDDEATEGSETERDGSRRQAFVAAVMTTLGGYFFVTHLTDEYARHGASDGRFVALCGVVGCVGIIATLAVISLVTGRPLWGFPLPATTAGGAPDDESV